MNGFSFISAKPVLIEIGQDRLRLVDGERDFEAELERLPNGRLAEPSRQQLDARLREFLRPKAWQPSRRAICAIGARGVSLRRLSLPPAPEDQRERLLRLQIESEFPLPPGQLAWGTLTLDGQRPRPDLPQDAQEVLVFAVRRELIEDYQRLFMACRLDPVFTLAALARARLCPPTSESWTLLDIQARDAELALFTDGVPTAIHCLPWGAKALSETPGEVTAPDATSLGRRLRVSGEFAGGRDLDGVVKAVGTVIGQDLPVEHVPLAPGSPSGAALQGLQRLTDHGRALPPLILKAESASTATGSLTGLRSKWALAAGILLLGCLLIRILGTSWERARLDRAIDQVRSYRESLPLIDQQLGFLQYLQTNRHPYLRIVALVAESAGPGMKVESLSLSRRGDLLIRGTLQGQQPPTEFRTKLVESGAFTSVVLEEQTPDQNQQRTAFRIAAQWDPESVRAMPELPAVTNKAVGSGPPGMSMPPGVSLPPGFTPPPGMATPPTMPEGAAVSGSPPGVVIQVPPQAP